MDFSVPTPRQPDVDEWIHDQDVNKFIESLQSVCRILSQTATIKPIIEYWVRSKLSLEIEFNDYHSSRITELQNSWFESLRIKKAVDGMPEQDRNKKIAVNYLAMEWAKEQWSYNIESIYLDQKNSLDRVKCCLVRVSNKNFALELYHRIKASELSFADASMQFGEGPETTSNGELPLQPVSGLPYGLNSIVARMKPDTLAMPARLGEKYAIVRLIERVDCPLNSDTEQLILQKQLEAWIRCVALKIYESSLC